ncbi:MAG TPA: T9SS type A sorting domain-containing protein [Bacteroidia bacterium]|nr:T9SS type A sorting domain-containing protein [Bacteroidia bacterium]HNU32580.1 T9SS type A sorting domain-containing protein [Bacteroidia bacterium]
MKTKTSFNKLLFTFIALLSCTLSNAQDTFYKAYGNTQSYNFRANAICNVNGIGIGYLVAGERNTPTTGSSDVCVIHINDSGAVQWSKTYGGSNDDVAWDIHPTQNGNYIVAGSTKSANGAFDMYVLVIDSAGDVLMSKTIGGPNLDIAYCISPTTDGGFVLAGRTQSFGAGNEEFYLIKVNSTLTVEWSRTIGNTNPDYAAWAEELPDQSIITCGYSVINGWDILLVKTDSIGNVQWKKNYGTPTENEYAYVVKPTPDGGYITAGDQTSNGGATRKALISKVNSSGNVEWCKSFLANGFSKLNGIYVDSTGFVFTGYVVNNGQTDALVIKSDFNGDTLFVKAIGSVTASDYSEKIIPDGLGGMVIAGHTSYVGNYGTDFLLIKADSNANAGCYSNSIAVTVTNLAVNAANFGNAGSGANAVNFSTTELAAPVTDTVFCSSILSSVPESSNNNFFSVYPNPATNEINISFKENSISNAKYIFYNARGEVILNGTLSPKQSILINELSKGIYYLKIITKDFSVVKKVVKVQW